MTRRQHLAAVPDQPSRALLYVRVSALMGRGGDTFLSPDIQTGTMRRALPTYGLREVAAVEDLDVSGTDFQREGLDRVLAMADARQFDVLLCYDTSRFGRDVLESLLFLRDLAARGVHIIAVTEGIDTSTDHGMSMLINMLNVAQLRAREIGRGWRQVIATRARAGKHHGPVPPTGYERGPGGRLQPRPGHAEAVTRAAREYAAGDAVGDVRRRLAAGTGKAITSTTLKRIMTSKVYLGFVMLDGRDGPIELPGQHEPLIEPQTWDRVQARVERDRGTPSRVLAGEYSITGLGKCGRCGGHTNLKPDRRRDGHTVQCGAARWQRCQGCGAAPLAAVERVVLERLAEYVRELRGDVTTAATKAARAARASGDVATLERELADTQAAMVRLADAYARGRMPEPVYETTMAGYVEADRRLREQLAGVRQVADAPDVAETSRLAEHVLALWDEMTGRERNTVLRKLVRRVVVQPAARRHQPYGERVAVKWL